jgi:hypothetical protein
MENLSNPTNSFYVLSYVIYFFFVTGLTYGVARILFRNSKEFMFVIFSGKETLALATNRLFEVGFFLFGFGIGLWNLIIYNDIETYRSVFEVLSQKVGGFTLFIGFLLFANLYLFFRGMKHRNRSDNQRIDIQNV